MIHPKWEKTPDSRDEPVLCPRIADNLANNHREIVSLGILLVATWHKDTSASEK